ncbi:MAG: slipin family protein [Deltaproteobacteria bacterium]|nr:slipin family protein [Deltaproteobacteria bacterium]
MFYILAIVLLILFLSAANTKGPGLIIIIPVVDKLVRVSLRLVAMDVPPQDVITRDNVSVKVNAVIYFRVMEPNSAVIEVENYLFATSQMAQTTLRSVCGQVELDELLSERDKINTMAKQAEAERERRAKVINAEGEFQAATRLADAAGKIQDFPMALQLRYLQTLREVSAENNSTTLFPIPIDLFKPFMRKDTVE